MPDNNFVNIMLISGNINYFNRIIKKYDTLAEYQALGSYYITTVNFDPGNNLQTTLVLGTSGVNALTYDCNYLLVYTTTNNTTTIQQRWWVMDQKRTRAGQYTLSLKRDVIADFYDIVTEAPCFIEKATIRDNSNPLIFNKEDMTLNQIKKNETFLKDETNVAWLVGYIARNYTGETFSSNYDARFDYDSDTLPYTAGTYSCVNNVSIDLDVYIDFIDGVYYLQKNYISFNNAKFSSFTAHPGNVIKSPGSVTNYPYQAKRGVGNSPIIPNPVAICNAVGGQMVINKASIETAFRTTTGTVSEDDYEEIINLNGKIYKDTSVTPAKYYRINVLSSILHTIWRVTSDTAFGVAIDTSIKKPVQQNIVDLTGGYDSAAGYTKMNISEATLNVSFTEIFPEGYTISISNTRNRLNDAPYDMFCIPYPATGYIKAITSWTSTSVYSYIPIMRSSSMHVAEIIASHLGPNDYLYDIQILPYCPMRNLMGSFELGSENFEQCLNLIALTENKDYDKVIATQNSNPVNVIFWSTTSTRSIDIFHNISIQNAKIENETKMFRLVSPNYCGMFEFSPAMNGGVNYFHVDLTYKPYQPYIHVNPNFKSLYGDDFYDNRGLICGGDFSIALVDDKWANFQINNKNYQLIFDREVQSLEFTRRQERVKELIGGFSGIAQGAASGAAAGGVYGAAAGAALSTVGGVIDIAMSEAQYKENLSLKKDLYNYNLGNIQALPNSLVKSMSLNANYKYWPFLEEYECTDIEKEALVKKLKYDGMTVMVIGKMSDYIVEDEETFIKGQIIRLENLPEASDVAYEIYNEIKRGVFI